MDERPALFVVRHRSRRRRYKGLVYDLDRNGYRHWPPPSPHDPCSRSTVCRSCHVNVMIHNTSWVTAHFHLIFGGATVIMYQLVDGDRHAGGRRDPGVPAPWPRAAERSAARSLGRDLPCRWPPPTPDRRAPHSLRCARRRVSPGPAPRLRKFPMETPRTAPLSLSTARPATVSKG